MQREVRKILPKISSRPVLCLLEDNCFQVLTFCNKRSLKEGICVHSPIVKLGLHYNLYLNNNLLTLHGKCFGIENARQFFDEMPSRDVVSWTGMLSSYAKHGKHVEALELFDLMRISGQHPNEFTFSNVVRSCSALGEFYHGVRIHACAIKHGLVSNPVLGSNLIDFYSMGDYTEEASKVFTMISDGDILSWTVMISSFVQAQDWSRALKFYADMIEAGVSPNEYTFVKLLTACSSLGIQYGKLIHSQLIAWGVELNLVVKTALTDMYTKCQKMEEALMVANLTTDKDVLLWTTLVTGFTQNMMFGEAIAAYCEMVTSGIAPNNYTFAGVLNACSSIPALELGEQMHALVIKDGLDHDISVGNALVHMYLKFPHRIEDALGVFKGITSPDVISWTTLIHGLAEHGLQQEVFQAFDEMRYAGEKPNSFTLSTMLGVCGETKFPSLITKLHGFIIKTKSDYDIVVGNALVDAYAGSGRVDDAWSVIRTISHRDAITFTSLVTKLNQIGYHAMALDIVNDMHNDDIKMDGFSLSSFLSASAGLAAMEPGKQLHCHSVKSGLTTWISVSNGLVDMYGKCGCVQDAHRAFEEISKPDVVSWNGLMFGLASNGHISSSLSAFEDMKLAGEIPDSISLLILLYACSHGGLVDLGLEYFKSMTGSYVILPQFDHYVSLVDLLGRAGRLEEGLEVIETMPFPPDALIYKTLLAACKLHGNLPLGEDVATRGLKCDPDDPAIYVLLANLYDCSGKSELGDKTRRLMTERGLRKNPGQSWMEIRNKVHLFLAGDKTHPQINEIHEKIGLLVNEFKIRRYSYRHNKDSSHHSEKLAVAFGLLNAPSNAPIRIIKNIRMCTECHDFILNVTRVVNREIIVRDGNRFHCFNKGACSCRGYW